MHPDANFAGVYEVSDPGIRDLLRLGETCQHGGKRDEEKELFHVHSNASGGPASERGARAGARCETNGVFLPESDRLRRLPGCKTTPFVISGPPHANAMIEWSNL